MQLIIRDNVRSLYLARVNCGLESWTNWDWADLLKLIEGETLDVETDFLFRDQLNTSGFPSERVEELMKALPEDKSAQCKMRARRALEGGMRVMDWMVSKVHDDIRPLRKLCRNCHHHSDKSAKVCENCGKDSHFEVLA